MAKNKKALKELVAFMVLISIFIGSSVYYIYFFTPKNSLELYQQIRFSKDMEEVQGYMLDGFEDNLIEIDFNYIKENSPNWIGQFTLFEFNDKSYIVMTTPGTERLKILSIDELPSEMREFFLGMYNKINTN